MEKILCAAIHYTLYPGCFAQQVHPIKNHHEYPGVVICGHRHHNIIALWSHLMKGKTGPHDEQGFLTSFNRFVDRKEAYKIAYLAGQLLTFVPWEDGRELYSEDIY
jgi:hypothetical protein